MKNKQITQKQLIKEALLKGEAISPIDGYRIARTIRLSGIIFELREEGMNIKNLHPKGSYALYTL